MPQVVTILGAGAMGSALATPLSRNGHRVSIWGTRLDEARLAALSAGDPHPATGARPPAGVTCFHADQLAAALDGAAAVIFAVSSVAVYGLAVRVREHLAGNAMPVLLVSKGFHQRSDGTIALMPEAVREGLAEPDRSIVAIGGPCKADEVAAGRLTFTVYAARQRRDVESAAALLSTDEYRVEASTDEIGLEICAPMKNVYAIALGYAAGLQQRTGQPWHNLQSALFARATSELAYLSDLAGGQDRTAFGLAGVGDLEVTGLSGRNRVFGSRLGAGETIAQAETAMRAADLTVEGIPACALGFRLADQLGAATARIALLHAVHRVLHGEDPLATFRAALGSSCG